MLNHDCMAKKPESIFSIINVYSTSLHLPVAWGNADTLVYGTFPKT